MWRLVGWNPWKAGSIVWMGERPTKSIDDAHTYQALAAVAEAARATEEVAFGLPRWMPTEMEDLRDIQSHIWVPPKHRRKT